MVANFTYLKHYPAAPAVTPILMSSAIRIALCSALLCLLIGCQPPPPKIVNNDSTYGIGPFDSRGRYREDWADDPSKWRRPVATPPSVAQNTSSSSSSTSSSSSSTRPTVTTPKPRPKPTVTRHTVKRGDTLSHIARRYGSSVAAIAVKRSSKPSRRAAQPITAASSRRGARRRPPSA